MSLRRAIAVKSFMAFDCCSHAVGVAESDLRRR